MPDWAERVLDGLGVVVVLVLLAAAYLVVRRRVLAHRGGTFELSLNHRTRDDARPGARGWTLGVGRYAGDRLEWYRVFSFRFRPGLVMARGQLDVVGRRDPVGSEAYALYSGHVIVSAVVDGRDLMLALSPESLTGLLAWVESSPPGHASNRVI